MSDPNQTSQEHWDGSGEFVPEGAFAEEDAAYEAHIAIHGEDQPDDREPLVAPAGIGVLHSLSLGGGAPSDEPEAVVDDKFITDYLGDTEDYQATLVDPCGDLLPDEPSYPTLVDFKEILDRCPPFREYLRFATVQTEAPHIYHLGAFFHILAGCAPETLHVHPDEGPSFSPKILYSLLMGESGNKKTTAGDQGQALLEDVIGNSTTGIPGSLAALSKLYNEQPNAVMYYPEGAVFLGSTGKTKQLDGLRERLTSLWDGRQIREVLVGESRESETREVSPLMMICAVPSTVQDHTSAADYRGGFFPRFAVLGADIDYDHSIFADTRFDQYRHHEGRDKAAAKADYWRIKNRLQIAGNLIPDKPDYQFDPWRNLARKLSNGREFPVCGKPSSELEVIGLVRYLWEEYGISTTASWPAVMEKARDTMRLLGLPRDPTGYDPLFVEPRPSGWDTHPCVGLSAHAKRRHAEFQGSLRKIRGTVKGNSWLTGACGRVERIAMGAAVLTGWILGEAQQPGWKVSLDAWICGETFARMSLQSIQVLGARPPSEMTESELVEAIPLWVAVEAESRALVTLRSLRAHFKGVPSRRVAGAMQTLISSGIVRQEKAGAYTRVFLEDRTQLEVDQAAVAAFKEKEIQEANGQSFESAAANGFH